MYLYNNNVVYMCLHVYLKVETCHAKLPTEAVSRGNCMLPFACLHMPFYMLMAYRRPHSQEREVFTATR